MQYLYGSFRFAIGHSAFSRRRNFHFRAAVRKTSAMLLSYCRSTTAAASFVPEPSAPSGKRNEGKRLRGSAATVQWVRNGELDRGWPELGRLLPVDRTIFSGTKARSSSMWTDRQIEAAAAAAAEKANGGRFACAPGSRFDGGMVPRILTILTGRNLPKIRQSREPEPSIVNEKTIGDFARVVEQTAILKHGPDSAEARQSDE
jgi:hypothetical protein